MVLNNEEDITNNGAYTVWLFLDGNWRQVIIDDLLPVAFNFYIFSSHKKELWICLIEKAYAKAFKSYENIERGLIGPMLTALTGAPYEYLNTNSKLQVNPDQVWSFLRSSLEKGYIMTVSTESNDRNLYF
jgi:hypothetical protein